MSKRKCAAFMCSKTTRDGVSLHKFPENFSHLWIFAVDRGPTWLPNSSSRLCSDHFHKDDFEIIARNKTLKVGRQPFPVKTTSIREQDKILVASRIKLETLRRDELAFKTEKENFEKLKSTNPDLWTIINTLKTMKTRLENLAMEVNQRSAESWSDNEFRIIISQVDSVHSKLETFIKKNKGYCEKIQFDAETPKTECIKEEEVFGFPNNPTVIQNQEEHYLPPNLCEELILECESDNLFPSFDKVDIDKDSMINEENIGNDINEFHEDALNQLNINNLETTSKPNSLLMGDNKENEVGTIGFDNYPSQQLVMKAVNATILEVDKSKENLTDKESAQQLDRVDVVATTVTEINDETVKADEVEDSTVTEINDETITADDAEDFTVTEINDETVTADDVNDNLDNTDTVEKQLLCLVCDESFHTKLIRNHVEQNHGNGPYQCKRCDGKPENYKELQKHTNWHSPPAVAPKQCDICLKNFSSNHSMKAHRRIHTDTKQPCEICQKLLFPFDMGLHIKRVHEEWRHTKCDFCEKTFAELGSLRLHLRTHTGERPYKCETCGDSFKQSAHLRTHIRIKHEGKKPKYEQKKVNPMCGVCGKILSSALSYKIHESTHTGVKPYKCDKCDKSFSKTSNLRNHMDVHNSNQPYSCDQCGKTMKHKQALKAHMKTHEPGYIAKTYTCDACSLTYKEAGNLRRHIKVFHEGKKPYICEICTQAFSNTNILRQHMRIHTGEKPYHCEVCGKSFTQDSSLYMHRKKCQ